ncbi:MAG: LacI family DNA-binding transcriptional regulator [Candidatus Omnitrophota bacterium]
MNKGLKEIAGKLGLNISTISRAINVETQHLVKEETRKRIFELIKKEGFKPNIKARNLKKQSLTNFSLIIPIGIKSIFYNEYYNSIINGINKVLMGSEYLLTLLPIEENYEPENIFQLLLNTETAGLILSPYCKYIKFPFDLMNKYTFPIVSIDNKVSGKNIYNIILNHKNAGYHAAEILWEKGYRDIVLISDVAHSEHSTLRKEGFLEFFKDKNANINNIEVPFTFVSGEVTIKKIKERNKFPICIFSLNDEVAVGIINQLKKNNLECTKDLSILGFDGLSIGAYLSPRLSSMGFPFENIGRLTAQILIDVLTNKKVQKTTILEARITEGESC